MKWITFNWPWTRTAALEDFVVGQSQVIKQLEQRCNEYDKKFEEIRVRLSNSEQKEEETKIVSSTDWLTERRRLESKFAPKGDSSAKQSNLA